jgi:hypothetical protein
MTVKAFQRRTQVGASAERPGNVGRENDFPANAKRDMLNIGVSDEMSGRHDDLRFSCQRALATRVELRADPGLLRVLRSVTG